MKLITYSGRLIDPFDFKKSDIWLPDIVHSLANTCRFNGHTPRFWSVAQHSLLVSELCDPVLFALLHDAAEAYIGDIVRPVKGHESMSPVREVESKICKVIFDFLGFDKNPTLTTDADEVADADNLALEVELAQFWGHINPLYRTDPRYSYDFNRIINMPIREVKVEFSRRIFEEIRCGAVDNEDALSQLTKDNL